MPFGIMDANVVVKFTPRMECDGTYPATPLDRHGIIVIYWINDDGLAAMEFFNGSAHFSSSLSQRSDVTRFSMWPTMR
jgi:hypothetical protein